MENFVYFGGIVLLLLALYAAYKLSPFIISPSSAQNAALDRMEREADAMTVKNEYLYHGYKIQINSSDGAWYAVYTNIRTGECGATEDYYFPKTAADVAEFEIDEILEGAL